MSLQSIGGIGFPFPGLPIDIGAEITEASYPFLQTLNYVLDAAGEKVGFKFRASEAKNIHKIHIRTATVTTGDTLDVRVETISTGTGFPSNTLWATNTNAALVIAGSDDNVWKTATLTADATLALGDDVGIVIVNGGGGGDMAFGNLRYITGGSTFGLIYDGGWAIQQGMPLILVEFSDASFATLGMDSNHSGVPEIATISSVSSVTRIGNIFELPFPSSTKGCYTWNYGGVSGDFTVKLYAADGTTVLATTPTILGTSLVTASRPGFYPWTASVNLSAGVAYRVAVVPTSSTDIYPNFWTFPSAAVLDIFTGGQDCHYSEYNTGAWVETTTARAAVGIYMSSFDTGGGGGAGGGLRLAGRGGLASGA